MYECGDGERLEVAVSVCAYQRSCYGIILPLPLESGVGSSLLPLSFLQQARPLASKDIHEPLSQERLCKLDSLVSRVFHTMEALSDFTAACL